jgi:hypothetical protein
MSATMFNGPLSSGYRPTKAVLISATEFTVDFELVISGSTATVQYYLEFGEDPDPNAKWYREIAEEDAGGGVVLMPVVIRSLAANAGGNLPVGTHLLDAEFKRRHRFVRLQLSSAGTVACTVTAPFADQVY